MFLKHANQSIYIAAIQNLYHKQYFIVIFYNPSFYTLAMVISASLNICEAHRSPVTEKNTKETLFGITLTDMEPTVCEPLRSRDTSPYVNMPISTRGSPTYINIKPRKGDYVEIRPNDSSLEHTYVNIESLRTTFRQPIATSTLQTVIGDLAIPTPDLTMDPSFQDTLPPPSPYCDNLILPVPFSDNVLPYSDNLILPYSDNLILPVPSDRNSWRVSHTPNCYSPAFKYTRKLLTRVKSGIRKKSKDSPMKKMTPETYSNGDFIFTKL